MFLSLLFSLSKSNEKKMSSGEDFLFRLEENGTLKLKKGNKCLH